MRCLIVDDEFYNRKLLQSILAPYGTYDIAVNGSEAVEAFIMALDDGNPYDLVLLDIMMPLMDGHEALKTIREYEKRVGIKPQDQAKIIMVTALDTPKDAVEAFYRGGCTDYLVKPIEKEKLLDVLKDYGLIK